MNERRSSPPLPDKAPEASSLIYQNILDNVASGVMSLDTDGVITSFNAAAENIFRLDSAAIIGNQFGEVFADKEGLEQFLDIIFEAIYDSTTVHQRVVEATLGGEIRSLSVATTYLKEERDGKALWTGIIVMFNDISEIRELREKELRLAKEVEGQHAELRNAYRDLEETNRKLGAASKKINIIRIGAALAIPILFVAIGLYFWDSRPNADRPDFGGDIAGTVPGAPGPIRSLVVERERVSSTVTMIGQLAPRREVEVAAPMKGKVGAVYVRAGQRVAQGEALLDMDVAKVQISRREAEVAYLKAREQVEMFENWSDHTEVSRVRQAVSKSRTRLESLNSRLEETAFLLERGIIPTSEYEAAEREHRNQSLDLQTAEQELQAVLEKSIPGLKVARLELENARTQLESIEEVLRKAAVTAPAAGVVMHPRRKDSTETNSGSTSDKLVKGALVERGDLLLTIGDTSGIAVVVHVDEVDVTQIHPGQPTRIVGDAFPGTVLHGKVDSISSQALPTHDHRRQPLFEVNAVVETLTEEQHRLLRLGMSARVEVLVYEKEDALLVPVEAVELREGRSWLRVRDRNSGEVRPVEVRIGMTTLNSVEIVSGITPGEEILVPSR